MQFIAHNHKVARLWVEAFCANLKIEKSEAAAMYANMCGFKTWDRLVDAIGKAPPSVPDEDVGEDLLLERRDFYTNVMVDIFAMNPNIARHLASSMSPSSGKLPKKIPIDLEMLYEADDEHFSLFQPGADISNIQDRMFKELLGDELGEDFDFSNISDRLRISTPVDPSGFFNYFHGLGFNPIDNSYDEDYEYGEPSFFMPFPESEQGNKRIPVYLTSLSYTPQDEQDKMADTVKSVVLQNAKEYMKDPEIILCWGKGLSKEVKGKNFTSLGSIYSKGKWGEFLMCENTNSIDKMFRTIGDIGDYNDPNPWFEDKGRMHYLGFIAATHGLETVRELQDYESFQVGGPSGWNMTLLGPKKETSHKKDESPKGEDSPLNDSFPIE